MLSVAEAFEHIARCVRPLAPARMRFNDSLGLRLAEDVVSGVDSPPFDKALVDGYAISLADDSATLHEIELVTAGGVPSKSLSTGATIRVMTGAPIPVGADAVVKWEDCELVGEGVIRNPARLTKAGAAVLRRGTAYRAGQKV